MYFTLIFSLFFYSLIPFETKAAEEIFCTIKDEKIIQPQLPIRSQDGSGFCYAFAANALIQQKYCEAKGGCNYGVMQDMRFGFGMSAEDLENLKYKGKALTELSQEEFQEFSKQLSDDRLSFLDTVNIGNDEKGLIRGGITYATLKNIKEFGYLAKESCSPITNFSNLVNLSPEQIVGKRLWWNKIDYLFRKYRKAKFASQEERNDFICRESNKLKQTLELKTSIDQIILAFSQRKLKNFSKQILIPKECEEEREKLPDFNIKRFRATKNRLSKKMDDILDYGRLFSISFCVNHDGEDCTGGNHAAVIQGRRKLCCKGVCKEQVKLFDSSSTYYEMGYKDSWVDKKDIVQRILDRSSFFQPNSPMLTWID